MTSLPSDSKENEGSSLDRIITCLNCGAPAPRKFCPECGQKTAGEPQTVAEFFDGLVAQYVSRESQLWQTLSKLFFVPGALTVEYIAGRRARYLRPLQLYLIASLIVFGAVQVFGLNLGLRFYGDQGVHVLRSSRLTATTTSRSRRPTPNRPAFAVSRLCHLTNGFRSCEHEGRSTCPTSFYFSYHSTD